MKKAIVLLSGGLDSSTALYLAKSQGFDEIYAITFEYGQKHDKELKSAIAIAKAAGVKEHKIVNYTITKIIYITSHHKRNEVAAHVS